MLLRGINDTEPALNQLSLVLSRIGPDEVHLAIPIRPPAKSWVKPPDAEGLARAKSILGNIAHVVTPVEGVFDYSGCDNLVDAVMHIITRHPIVASENPPHAHQQSSPP